MECVASKMRLQALCPLIFALFPTLSQNVACHSQVALNAGSSVTSYINKMTSVARKGLLENLGTAFGGSPGTVAVAYLPGIDDETVRPLYAFHYIRDAAMVYNAWIKQFVAGSDKTLRPVLDDCVSASIISQHVASPSGNIFTGGLSEPKMYLNLTPVLEDIPRPEDDGPAMRAIFMLDYAYWLLDHGGNALVTEVLWPSIHIDLLWITMVWNRTSYELDELSNTNSYWTSSVQYHALRDGSRLAQKIGLTWDVPKFEATARSVLDFMQTFWDGNDGYLRASTDLSRTVDIASLFATVYNFDIEAGCDAETFQPCSDKALSTIKVSVERFKTLYEVTRNYPPNKGSALGLFFEETVFDGGQPWFISSFACAQALYYALSTWNHLGELDITSISLPFFQIFNADIKVGRYTRLSWEYYSLRRSIQDYADSFVELAAKYTPESGVFTDMFNKTDGSPVGAPGYSWGYASALMTFEARRGAIPRSWGAKM